MSVKNVSSQSIMAIRHESFSKKNTKIVFRFNFRKLERVLENVESNFSKFDSNCSKGKYFLTKRKLEIMK